MPQDRRNINIATDIYEKLSFLQAETRLKMKEQKVGKILSKTAMTKILEALVTNASVDDLIDYLK